MAQGSHRGHMKSWVAVAIIWIGFAIGGVAMTTGPIWWLFWIGAGVVAVGGIIAIAVGIMDDVVLDDPRVVPETTHHSAIRYAAPDAEREIPVGSDPQA